MAAASIFVYVLRPLTVPQPKPGYHIPELGKGETAALNLVYLSSALRQGKSVVILGSSELEHRYGGGPYQPDIFIPAQHLAPVLSYGTKGFETLGMYGLLYALRVHLNPGTRLVIMLSPGWFQATDMQPATFNENFNDSVLLQLYMSDDPRGVFHDYLSAHETDFSAMTDTQRMFLGDPSGIVDWNFPWYITQVINARAYAQRIKLNLRLAQLDQPSTRPLFGTVHAADIPWERYEQIAAAHEKARMTNNDYWVRNNFYTELLKKYPQRFKNYYPADMNPEPEMTSLKLLMHMLQRSKVKALFVMQPLNSKVYQDHARFDDVDTRIANLCREYGMQYMDMYQQPLEQGVLTDTVHPGELGWLRIDHEIAEYFKL